MFWHECRRLMTTIANFRGTNDEQDALLRAIARYCECDWMPSGLHAAICATHQALAADPHLPGQLLFFRRIAHRLRAQEFAPNEWNRP